MLQVRNKDVFKITIFQTLNVFLEKTTAWKLVIKWKSQLPKANTPTSNWMLEIDSSSRDFEWKAKNKRLIEKAKSFKVEKLKVQMIIHKNEEP